MRTSRGSATSSGSCSASRTSRTSCWAVAAIIVAVSALLLLAGVAGGQVLAAVAVAIASLIAPRVMDRVLARPIRGVESLASTVAGPIARPLTRLSSRVRHRPPLGSSPRSAGTSTPGRCAGLAGAAVVVTLAIAIIAGLVWWTRGDAKNVAFVEEFDLRGTPAVQVDGRTPEDDLAWNGYPVDGYAHEDEPFTRDLFAELVATNNVRDSYLGVRNRDVTGKYVNIADGRRRTHRSSLPTDVVIWFFGGSTMFGIGQRDNHTIPSEVVRAAEGDGLGVQALNFGVNGDVRWQEVLRFADALDSDLPRPDLVVFYDGWNDLSLGQWRQSIGDDGTVDLRLPFNDDERDVQRAGRTLRSSSGPDAAAKGAALAAAQYRRTAATGDALADSEGIPVVTFWQPIAVTKAPAPSDEELYERIGLSTEFIPDLASSYRSVLPATGVEAIDLSGALDDIRRPVFIDQGRTNELGARTIATRIYEHLRPSIRTVAG